MEKIEIDLEKVNEEDELEGFKWKYISPSFDYANSIPKKYYNNYRVEDNGVLIHRQKVEGDRFDTSRYHFINDEDGVAKSYLISGKDLREYLTINFCQFVHDNEMIPFGCEIKKFIEKKNKYIISYCPLGSGNQLLQFTVKNDDLVYDITNLEKEENNNLGYIQKTEHTIEKINNPFLSNYVKLNVVKSEIVDINMRESRYLDNISYYYIIKLKSVKIEDGNVIDFVNIRCTKKSKEKYELNIGDFINFKGSIKNDKNLGTIIQNIRKFTKV